MKIRGLWMWIGLILVGISLRLVSPALAQTPAVPTTPARAIGEAIEDVIEDAAEAVETIEERKEQEEALDEAAAEEASEDDALPDPKVTPIGVDGGAGGHVVVLPIEGTIDLGIAPFVARVLEENASASAIILDIDTLGGRVDAAVQVRDALLDAKPPVIAYIDRRAISAGALIAYSADTIVFAPGATMGAATPITQGGDGQAEAVDEKYTSYMRAEMRATAEANGRDPTLAEGMVDRTIVVDGLVDEEHLVTVTTDQAVRHGLADGVAATLPELLEDLGLHLAEEEKAEENWGEDIARILTEPTLSGMLMSIGMLGILIELYTPGFGLAGGLGVLCLSLFFGGHVAANLAGWEEVILLGGGLVCLAAEIFIIPGFGVVGIAGVLLVLGALSLSLVGLPIDLSWGFGLITDALERVLLSMAATIAVLVALIKFLPERALPGWLILRTRLGDTKPAEPTAPEDWVANPQQAHLVGAEGTAVTDLRLAGKAEINGIVVDVVSLHEYIDKGTPVVVSEVEGVRVVVTRAAESSPPEASEPNPTPQADPE